MNNFTNEYNRIIGQTFIKYVVPNTKFTYYLFVPRVSDIDFVKRLSQEKVRFEMNHSQNAIIRDYTKKLEKTFEGTLAELATIQFLESVYKINSKYIKWYNIERNTFRYVPKEEYDIRLNDHIDIGVRSSYYKESANMAEVFSSNKMDYFLYKNKVKGMDKIDNFEMRVLYHTAPKYIPRSIDEMIKKLNDGTIKIYIVGGIRCSEIQSRGKYKQMGQNNTQYLTLNLKDGPCLDEFFFEIKNTFNFE